MEVPGEDRLFVVDPLGEQVRQEFVTFLQVFREAGASPDAPPYYEVHLQDMIEADRSTLYANFEHIAAYSEELAAAVESHWYRVEPFLREAIAIFVREKNAGFMMEDDYNEKEFWISVYNCAQFSSIRGLRTDMVGRLVRISGTVTRTTEVRPELITGVFQCNECGTVVHGVAQEFRYTEPTICPREGCQNRIHWTLRMDQSRFVDWQRVRVQESSNEIPSGSMPRTMDIILRNDAVEKAKAGDRLFFTGCLVVMPDVSVLRLPGARAQLQRGGDRRRGTGGGTGDGVTGLKELGVRDLTYRTAFIACATQNPDDMERVNPTPDEIEDRETVMRTMTEAQQQRLVEMREHPELYEAMAKSVCPTVFGHDDIKRGILMLLFGGVPKRTPEGVHLRGDVNVCIVGDPSTAKSQFLKYVTDLMPRTVYTSGQASSAAGLTAAVVRDSESGEFCVEAGALMLADNGVCCIDEFDKMDMKDQVAIHEAMEQQTISIAKAGIHATLNAHASILAAANPIGGRYDVTKPLRRNITLTPPIMSRFDLFFVVLDEPDRARDARLARHIVGVHMLEETVVAAPFDREDLLAYIRFARTLSPRFTPEAAEAVTEAYPKMRQSDASDSRRGAYRITVRQLESVLRLSEALARLHLRTDVTAEFVEEAIRMVQKSIIRVENHDVTISAPRLAVSRPTAGLDAAEEPSDNVFVPNADTDDPQGGDGAVTDGDAGAVEQARMPITFEKYHHIANSLVMYLRRNEQKFPDGAPQRELVSWYVSRLPLEGDELAVEAAIVNQVVNRLTVEDGVLLCNVPDGQDPEEALMDEQGRLLVANPNYFFDD